MRVRYKLHHQYLHLFVLFYFVSFSFVFFCFQPYLLTTTDIFFTYGGPCFFIFPSFFGILSPLSCYTPLVVGFYFLLFILFFSLAVITGHLHLFRKKKSVRAYEIRKWWMSIGQGWWVEKTKQRFNVETPIADIITTASWSLPTPMKLYRNASFQYPLFDHDVRGSNLQFVSFNADSSIE